MAHACSISGTERSSLPDVARCGPMMAPHLAPHRYESSRARKLASVAEPERRARSLCRHSMPGARSQRVVEEPWHSARVPAVRSGQGCLGGHQLSRSDPGRSVRILPGFGVHRRRLRTALSRGLTAARLEPSVKTGCCRGPLPPGAAEEPEGVCLGSRIGHPCGNLHRAGLTGRPLAGVPPT
jgi:hypothetical protein